MQIAGGVTDVAATGFGPVTLASGSANISLSASRATNDQLKIDDGTLTGSLHLKGDPQTNATASLALKNILYYRGVGSAKLDFFIENASYHVPVVPGDSAHGFMGGQTLIHFTPRDIQLNLNRHVGFSNADVRVDNGAWSIPEQGFQIAIGAHVTTGEFADITVQLGNSTLGYSTVCAPHVNINTSDYLFTANADLTLTSNQRRFIVDGVQITPAFDIDVDQRGCSQAAAGICGIIGTALIGGDIFAGAALGIACGNEVVKYSGIMNDQLHSTVSNSIKSLKLDVVF